MTRNIKVAIAGVGNCASSLVQGVEYYRSRRNAALDGVMRQTIGDYRASDVEFVAAFDVDERKVGRSLEEAIFAKPNNTRVFQSSLPVSNVVVQMGPLLDGVAAHMADYDDDVAFRPADLEPTDIIRALRKSGAEVLLCYLPVGSEKAVKHYAQACLEAGVAMVNCVPVFLASDPEWAQKFRDARVPIIGDDIKSQVGATIVHRSLARLFADRGVAPHMADYEDDVAFRPADLEPTDIAEALRKSGAEVLLCYLPVGSDKAVKHYAQACLEAGVAMVNCVPVFLASDPEWAQKFHDAGLPIVGDDIKSQVGATIVHRSLARLFADRGVALDRTYQLNTAGNTDFLNMLERKRLKSKKFSKTESVQSQLDERLDDADIHIGPSDYIPWQHDNKIAFIRLEGRGFGDAPLEVELRLSVQDSSNSAGVVIDALRCAKLGLERGLGGPLEAPSAYYMKSPPRQFRDSVARDACNAFIDGEAFDVPREAPKSVRVAGRGRS
jgi:myo-inositol-1-phosphate synthase